MTTYCTIPDVNALFGDISDDISTGMFNISIDNAGSWIDSALLRNHIPIPEIEVLSDDDDSDDILNEEPVDDIDNESETITDTVEEIESTVTVTPSLILVGVPSILKTASIYFAASDIIMSLYHGDQYQSLMDYWFNKATQLLESYIDAYKADNNIDSNVNHRNAPTYKEAVNHGHRNRRYY